MTGQSRLPQPASLSCNPRSSCQQTPSFQTSYDATSNMPPTVTHTPCDTIFMHDANSRGVLGAISQSAWNQPRSNESQRRTVGARTPSAGRYTQTTSRPLGANALLEGSVASPRVGHDPSDHPLVPDKDLWGHKVVKNDVLRVDTAWENRYDSDRAFIQRANSTSSAASSLSHRDRTNFGQLAFAALGGSQMSAQSSLSQRVFSPPCPPSQHQQQQSVSNGRNALKYDHSSLTFGPAIKTSNVQSVWNTNLSKQTAMSEQQAVSGASVDQSDSSFHGVATHNLAARRRHITPNRPVDNFGWSDFTSPGLTDQSELRRSVAYPRQNTYAGSQFTYPLVSPMDTMTMSGAESDSWSDTNMSYNPSSALGDYQASCQTTNRNFGQFGGIDAPVSRHEDTAYNMPRSGCRMDPFSNRNPPDSAISLSRHGVTGNYPSFESRVQPERARAGMRMISPNDWLSTDYAGAGRLARDDSSPNSTWPQTFNMLNGLYQQDVMSFGQPRDRFRAQHEQDVMMSGYSYSPQMIASPETSGFRSRLLEDFKSKSKGSRRWDLREIYNHIPEFAGDQLGSRFIQEKLETANSEEKARVFAELLPCAPQLSVCVFGNYVIQKFFEHGDQLQKKQLANTLTGRVLYNSLNTYGCRVVQKALEHILLPQQLSLVEELRTHVIKCVMNQNGNHVIAMAIEQIPAQHVRFIVESFYGHIQQLSADKYACRIVQRLLERGEDVPRRIIMRELLTCANQLIANDYGNYVVQELVQHGSASDKAHIFNLVQVNLIVFCRHKFASNVVERCLVFGTDTDRRHVLRQLTVRAGDVRGDSILSTLARDQFGNYVVQRLLETLSEPENEQYAAHLAPEVAKARRFGANKYLDEVEKCLYRFVNRKDERCKGMTGTPTPPLTADGSQTPRTSSVLSHTDESSQALPGAAFADTKQMPTIEISEAAT